MIYGEHRYATFHFSKTILFLDLGFYKKKRQKVFQLRRNVRGIPIQWISTWGRPAQGVEPFANICLKTGSVCWHGDALLDNTDDMHICMNMNVLKRKFRIFSLQWRHNERDCVWNHHPHDCLLNRLFKAQIKENTKAPRHWLLWGELTGDRWILRTKCQ